MWYTFQNNEWHTESDSRVTITLYFDFEVDSCELDVVIIEVDSSELDVVIIDIHTKLLRSSQSFYKTPQVSLPNYGSSPYQRL